MDELNEIKQLLNELVENKDSFSIGSASRGGIVKFYCDYNDLDGCKKKIDNARELKRYAQLKLDMG